MEQVTVPEARGKAAAFDRWLAQGGKPFKVSGRFKEGPMKGLTYDQAKQKFEGIWAGSSDALKEKYAGRAQTDLAPSERIQGISPVIPRKTPVSTGMTAGPTSAMKATNAAPTPARTPVSAIPGVSPAPRAMTDLPTDERMHAQGKTNAGGVPVNKTPAQMTSMPTDERMHAQGKTNAGGVAPVKVPNAAVGMTPTTPATRVNRLTGLPFGYRPGDQVAPQFKAAADASVARQAAAVSSVTPARPPSILSQSQINRVRTVSTGVEARAADEMRRQAAINANPGTVNPDDPKKFFTGRTLPLDQLVKRQKLQGIGTPARQ